MRFEEHCSRSESLLGDRFEQVHIWLDHYAVVPSTTDIPAHYDPTHRQYRHHVVGILEVRRRWGKKAATAAVVHILDDMFPDGWNEQDATKIPWDQLDHLRMHGP